jgi:MFS family permease
MTEALAPLRLAPYRRMWLVALISNLGGFFQTVAASWLMKELTNSSATWVGLMIASSFLPLLAFGLLAGVAADAFDKARVMGISLTVNALAAAAMAGLTFTGLIRPGTLFVLGLVMGTGSAFSLPAWQSLVSDLVPRSMIPSAIALNSAAFNLARAVGPALGGLVVAGLGPEIGFSLNAISFLGLIAVAFSMAGANHSLRLSRSELSSAMGLSIRFARFTPPFRRMLALVGIFGLTSAAVQATLPNRTEELGGSETLYGLLLAAMGVGALLAAFTRPRLQNRLGPPSLPLTLTGFGIGGVILGWADSPWPAAWAMVVAGACWVWTLTTLNASTQLIAPEWVRGRAMSLYTLAFSGVYPIGSIVAGLVADRIGAGMTDVVFSVAGIGLGLVAPRFRIPSLLDIESPEFEEDRVLPVHADTEGGPVMIINTWTIDRTRLEEFLAVMSEVRQVRLRTGAYRWRLYRNSEDPHRISEMFLCVSWEEHLAQHGRIDDRAAALIRTARSFDRGGEPTTRHLIAVDVERPEAWEALHSAHADFHRTDGSIPIDDDRA